MIRMIALDLDGTLALANHKVSPATRDALADLHEGGVEVVIATGRRYRTTRYVIENLGFDVFAVCNGGALVKTPDQQTLHRETFDIRPLVEVAREFRLTLFAQRDVHDHGGSDFVLDNDTSWNEMTRRHQQNNSEFCDSSDLSQADPEFLVSGIMGTEDELNQLALEIESQFGNTYNTIIVPHLETGFFYCEISQGHVDKWHGLSRLKEHLQIEADHICAVGDQLNDMAMITAAGHGVAMENGHEDLQASAHFVCGHNEKDGILDVVSYIHEVNEQAAE